MFSGFDAFELSATYDPRKRFYGKARVFKWPTGEIELWSYDTKVMTIGRDGAISRRKGQPQSQTTARHMAEFVKQFTTDCIDKPSDVRRYPATF